MKSFYGGTYISKELLAQNNIYHPIRLEYYKTENQSKNKVFYGIEIVKTEYKKEEVKIEKNEIENITRRGKEILSLLEKLKIGSVTPYFLEEMLKEEIESKKSYVGKN